VRVVKNLYPVAYEGARAAHHPVSGRAAPLFGVHEVVIESREHDVDLPDYSVDHLADVLGVYRDRMRALATMEGIQHVSAFRNRGTKAGSSQPHPHGQLLATCVPGVEATRRYDIACAHEGPHNLLTTVLSSEIAEGARIVHEGPQFVLLCPFAPQLDHELWVVPRDSRGAFRELADERLGPLASALKDAVARLLRVCLGNYNLVFREPPVGAQAAHGRFWYLALLPRPGLGAGFELESGTRIVTVSPEHAAAELRD
jgi:UDPglucose--hexose-1-phosphate uridylyltransferase